MNLFKTACSRRTERLQRRWRLLLEMRIRSYLSCGLAAPSSHAMRVTEKEAALERRDLRQHKRELDEGYDYAVRRWQ
ncbi:MAG TPA: hypothetical protein VNA25_04930 [Phycisphaerae bacterium]|nr:hypothetical protein [Phycisphaerae bacterium]